MSMSDPIADMLTRIRNAQAVDSYQKRASHGKTVGQDAGFQSQGRDCSRA